MFHIIKEIKLKLYYDSCRLFALTEHNSIGATDGLGKGLKSLKSAVTLPFRQAVGLHIRFCFGTGRISRLNLFDAGFLTISSVLCCAGLLTGNKIAGLRMRLQDGAHHVVDSSDLAFNLATQGAMKQGTLTMITSCQFFSRRR